MVRFIDKDVEERTGLLKCNRSKPCMICGSPTFFIEICSEGYICSSECETYFYKLVEAQE